jgi:hypothetical protein
MLIKQNHAKKTQNKPEQIHLLREIFTAPLDEWILPASTDPT